MNHILVVTDFGKDDMREFKYKTWDIKSRLMFGPIDISELRLPKNWKEYYVPLQFTGLLDKDGIEIYDGDILRVHSHYNDHDGQLMAVEWGKFGWTVKSKNWYSLTDHDNFSIVGNIYENTGLL